MGLHDLYMCLQLAVHVSLAALDWYVIEEAWWNTPSTIFLPTPTTQVHSPAIRLLYITQLVRSTHLPFVVVVSRSRSRSRSRSTTLTFVLLCFLWQGVWIYTCFIHRFVDARRKDYFVMYAHHVVTIALVGTCHRSDGPPCPPRWPTK